MKFCAIVQPAEFLDNFVEFFQELGVPLVALICENLWNVADGFCNFKMLLISVKLLFNPKLPANYKLIVDRAYDNFEMVPLCWKALVKMLQIHLISSRTKLEWCVALVSVVLAFFVHRCEGWVSAEEVGLSQPSEDYSIVGMLTHNSIFLDGSLHSDLPWNHGLEGTLLLFDIIETGLSFNCRGHYSIKAFLCEL